MVSTLDFGNTTRVGATAMEKARHYELFTDINKTIQKMKVKSHNHSQLGR